MTESSMAGNSDESNEVVVPVREIEIFTKTGVTSTEYDFRAKVVKTSDPKVRTSVMESVEGSSSKVKTENQSEDKSAHPASVEKENFPQPALIQELSSSSKTSPGSSEQPAEGKIQSSGSPSATTPNPQTKPN